MQNSYTNHTSNQWVSVNLDQLRHHLRARLPCDDDAQDIAQEACLQLLQFKQPETIRDPKAYLYRVAYNLVYQHYRDHRNTHHTDSSVDVDTLTSTEPSLQEAAILGTRRRQIHQAMQELPPKCQTALSLRWHQGHQVTEIAERMNLSTAMVKKYLAYGLAHFRKRLQRFVVADQPTT